LATVPFANKEEKKMRSGFRIGRVFGIEIDIDWSWLFIFFLIVWDLGTVFDQLHPKWAGGLVWSAAIAAALLFFVSVLLHELAHSLMAQSQGVPVRSITLFLFGGVSDIQREPPSPRAEFLITIVGPLTSLIIGVTLLLLAGVSASPIDAMTGSTSSMSGLSLLSTILLWLGSINILLAVFNMIPGFPLDGGRVLRSILWTITGNLRRATQWASQVGQIIAWLFIIAGIMMVFGYDIPLLGTGLINGLWIAFIGWFLNSAALQSYRQVVIHDMLHGVPVTRLMRSNPPTVSSTVSISSLVHDYVMGTDDHAFPVIDDGQLVGIVTLEDIRTVKRDAWDARNVQQIMTPTNQLEVAAPDEDAADALDKLAKRDVHQLPVVRDGKLIGLLRQRDILKWLHLQSGTQTGLTV
jgi:Zn-dependent protease/predicted transcriptional regulator